LCYLKLQSNKAHIARFKLVNMLFLNLLFIKFKEVGEQRISDNAYLVGQLYPTGSLDSAALAAATSL
jgi:hypothetical protein